MKKTLLTIAAVLALSSLSSAWAAPQVLGDGRSDSVQIKAAEAYRAQAQDLQEYARSYYLSNDEKIHFSQRVAHFYAQVGREKKVELFAVSPGVFVTTAGAKVAFSDDGHAVTITNYERLPLAQALPAGTVMVAGR